MSRLSENPTIESLNHIIRNFRILPLIVPSNAPRRTWLMSGRRQGDPVSSTIDASNITHNRHFSLLEEYWRCRRNMRNRLRPEVANCLIDTPHYRPILPGLDRFIDQRYTMTPKHVAVSDVHKLQKLHGCNRRVASRSAFIKDLLGNGACIFTHLLPSLGNIDSSKMRRESA